MQIVDANAASKLEVAGSKPVARFLPLGNQVHRRRRLRTLGGGRDPGGGALVTIEEELRSNTGEGSMRAIVQHRYVLRYLEEGHSRGKVVVTP